MASYVIMLPVPPRLRLKYSKEEIEKAAEIIFYAHPPAECEILRVDEPQWIDTMFGAEMSMIRVTGDVTPGEEELAHAKDES